MSSEVSPARDVTRILVNLLAHEPFKLIITHDRPRLVVMRVDFEQNAADPPPPSESEYLTSSVTIDNDNEIHVTNDSSRHTKHSISFQHSDGRPITLRIVQTPANAIICAFNEQV